MNQELLTREISATREEFKRGVEAAFNNARATPDGWVLEWEGARADIRLSPLPDLVIGLIRLPRLVCQIALTGEPPQNRAKLLERLDRYQHRGGG